MAIQDLLRFVGSLAGKSTPKTTGVDAEGMPVYKTGFWDTLYGSPGAQLNLEAQQNQGQFKRGVGRTPIIGELKRKEQALDTQSEAVTKAGLITLLKNSSDPNVRQVGEIMELTNTNEALQMRMLQEAYKNPATAKAILDKLTEPTREAAQQEANRKITEQTYTQREKFLPHQLRSLWNANRAQTLGNKRAETELQYLPGQLQDDAFTRSLRNLYMPGQFEYDLATRDAQLEMLNKQNANPYIQMPMPAYNPETGEVLSIDTGTEMYPFGDTGMMMPRQRRGVSVFNPSKSPSKSSSKGKPIPLPAGFAASVVGGQPVTTTNPEIQMPTRRGPVDAQAKKRKLQLQVGPIDVTGIYDQVAPIYRVMKKGARSLLPF